MKIHSNPVKSPTPQFFPHPWTKNHARIPRRFPGAGHELHGIVDGHPRGDGATSKLGGDDFWPKKWCTLEIYVTFNIDHMDDIWIIYG